MVEHIYSDNPKELQEKLNQLPAGARILSVYGLNSRHWAWIEMSAPAPAVVVVNNAPESEKPKTSKRGNSNGRS